ncbi:TPA: transposase [Escherichia coli]|nr:transposase [Escherichia coli]MDN0846377.1 transposase [Escherichia coli]HAZ3595225.1 transposase [Escherichia coli]HAZ3605028.1 transposase [Escherichia coli]HAZ3619141.1 transposase [Escherichia coli]
MPRSTWYHNINALKLVDRHTGLKDKIREIYHYHNGRYGYRRITLSLRKQGVLVNMNCPTLWGQPRNWPLID